MTFGQFALLFGAALVAGAINAVAGGGSFFTFPALVFTGVAPVTANATSTVALWPGSVASVGAYRRELAKIGRRDLLAFSIISVIGGVIGAFLLLRTSQKGFLAIVPYFLLFSTLAFALRGAITRWTHRRSGETPQSHWAFVRACALQFVIGIYGGYFGGGIGILMLASYSVLGMTDIHVMNALKTVLASVINGVAVLIFALSGIVVWPVALLMVVAAILGGYGGAAIARRLDPRWVQWFVVAVGAALTVYFFVYQ